MTTTRDDLIHLVKVGDNGEASVLRAYLQHHGIQVYVQGENHRSLLGMVGAFIELSIMVPQSQLEDARELLEEYNQDEPEDAPETRGVHRDQFDDEEEEEDDEWKDEMVAKAARRKALLAALVFPLGGGHLAMGAYLRGVALAVVSLYAIVHGVGGNPASLIIWAMAVVFDVYASSQLPMPTR